MLGRFLPDRGPADVRARQEALGYGLMRDGNGPRALDTMVRYRGAVLAELFRSLAALEALRAQAHGIPGAPRSSNRAAPESNEFEKARPNNDLARRHSAHRPRNARCRTCPRHFPSLQGVSLTAQLGPPPTR